MSQTKVARTIYINGEEFIPANAWHVEIPHQRQLVLSNSFAIHFWYRPALLALGAKVIQKHYPADHRYGNTWDINHYPGDVMVFSYCWPGSANNYQGVCTVPLTTNRQHVVYTYSEPENTFRVYVNGVFSKAEVPSHAVVPLDTPLSLLLMQDMGGYQSAQGGLDEVRIYNRSLSAFGNSAALHSPKATVAPVDEGSACRLLQPDDWGFLSTASFAGLECLDQCRCAIQGDFEQQQLTVF